MVRLPFARFRYRKCDSPCVPYGIVAAPDRIAIPQCAAPLNCCSLSPQESCDARTRTHRSAPRGADRLRRLPARADPVGSRAAGAMRPVLDAWVRMIAAARAAGVPVIYTTPVSRADGADVVMLPTDLSAETGVPPLTNGIEGTPEAGFPDEIAPRPEDYVFLKRRPSAFYGTGVAELLHMLRRDIDHHRRRRHQSRRRDQRPRGLQHGPRVGRGARVLLERRRGRPRLQPRQGDEDVRAHPAPSIRSRRCCKHERRSVFAELNAGGAVHNGADSRERTACRTR